MSKSYFRAGRRVTALEDVSLTVAPGRVTAVIGGRGSGKTTLINVAAGLVVPDSGHVLVNGERLDQLSDKALTRLRRTELGLVLGNDDGFSGARVIDGVALPLRLQTGDGRAALVEAAKALAAVGVEQCVDARFDEISGGERRLVSVARAIVAKPRVILLDQPATDLLVDEERVLLDVLRSLAHEAGVAVLMTVTSSTQAITADLVATISNGRLTTGGEPPEPRQAGVVSIEDRRHAAQGGTNDA